MKYISKFSIRWASIASLLIASLGNAQTVHISHCMAGCPVATSGSSAESEELIVRQLFVASINADTGLADWQAYRVLAGSVGVASLLPRVWFEDSLVRQPAAVVDSLEDGPQFIQSVSADAEERNYQLTEITLLSEDQGRLVPMSSFAGTPYWSELNFLSNMSPLPYALRLGSWSRLDQAINALADEIGEVYVVAGPIYGQPVVRDDEGTVQPSAYFKVVSTADSLSAFIFSSEVEQHANFCDQLSSLEAVEEGAGLKLFPQHENAFADTLHAQLSCAN
jgi:endonuclease G, mitochondrial